MRAVRGAREASTEGWTFSGPRGCDVDPIQDVAISPGKGVSEAKAFSSFDALEQGSGEQLFVALHIVSGVLLGHPQQE